eukprot:SAG31_NODE_1970_length_6766_cov_88.154792_3_plen_195_part_00
MWHGRCILIDEQGSTCLLREVCSKSAASYIRSCQLFLERRDLSAQILLYVLNAQSSGRIKKSESIDEIYEDYPLDQQISSHLLGCRQLRLHLLQGPHEWCMSGSRHLYGVVGQKSTQHLKAGAAIHAHRFKLWGTAGGSSSLRDGGSLHRQGQTAQQNTCVMQLLLNARSRAEGTALRHRCVVDSTYALGKGAL